MSDEQQPTGHLFPSTALRRVHAIMIGSAIAFAAGFAVYLLVIARTRASREGSTLAVDIGAAVSVVVGLVLARYLRGFLGRTRGRPS